MSERLDERLRRAARTYRRLGNHTAEGMFLEAADTICELQTDNAKLRELVKKLIILAFARCADCDLFDVSCALVPTQKCLLWNECESIARELGVEVDDG